jgi:divalent metal cation (Fe/Co/Zn/Cd) transporter
MDSILGMFCAAAIFFAAFKIMKESITKVLGEEPEAGLIEKLTAEVKQLYENDLEIHHFHLHNYISQKELTLHIMLDKNMTIAEAHEIENIIENMIREKFDMSATIHVDPL